jgi:hypothetical protein
MMLFAWLVTSSIRSFSATDVQESDRVSAYIRLLIFARRSVSTQLMSSVSLQADETDIVVESYHIWL